MNLIDKLPKNYNELSYKTYNKIINTLPAEKPAEMTVEEWNVYFHLTVLSIMLGIFVGELEKLPATELVQMINKISFLEVGLKPTKSSLKTKLYDELDYIEFVNYQKLRNDLWNNMEDLIKIVVKDEIKEELSVQEAYNVFFCLNKSIRKSILCSLISSGWKLLKMTAKEKLKKIFNKK